MQGNSVKTLTIGKDSSTPIHNAHLLAGYATSLVEDVETETSMWLDLLQCLELQTTWNVLFIYSFFKNVLWKVMKPSKVTHYIAMKTVVFGSLVGGSIPE